MGGELHLLEKKKKKMQDEDWFLGRGKERERLSKKTPKPWRINISARTFKMGHIN